MTKQVATSGGKFPVRIAIVAVVIAVFALFIAFKLMPETGDAQSAAQTPAGSTAPASAKISESHADASAAYAAAVAEGKPTYVLFHSLTCEPCVEISAVVDRVVPG